MISREWDDRIEYLHTSDDAIVRHAADQNATLRGYAICTAEVNSSGASVPIPDVGTEIIWLRYPNRLRKVGQDGVCRWSIRHLLRDANDDCYKQGSGCVRYVPGCCGMTGGSLGDAGDFQKE